MSKKKIKTKNTSIILNTLKMGSPYVCPNCGETQCTYVFKKGRKNVIDVGYYFEIAFIREVYHYEWHHCLTCGYEWEIRKYTEN